MQIGRRIKKNREYLHMTQNELALKVGMSRSYLADVERDRYNPSLSTLNKIADALNVSLDKLTGQSASIIIEDRLEELNISKLELSQKAKVSENYLTRLDDIQPDEADYEIITGVAKALGISPGKLRAALARQEPPLPDNDSIGVRSTPEEDFADSYHKSLTFPIDLTGLDERDIEMLQSMADMLRNKKSQKEEV